MTRRILTVVAAGLLALALGVISATLPVPFVALGPEPQTSGSRCRSWL